jgi:hypothetical protein
MKTWFWPIVIGILSAAGLLLALLYDGLGDWISCLMLLCPIATAVWCGWLRAPSGTPDDPYGDA